MTRTFTSIVFALASSTASADLLFPGASGTAVGPGMGAVSFVNVPPPTFNNDDVIGAEMIAPIFGTKRFDASATIDSPLLINTYGVAGVPTGTSVEYTINELVTNNTAQTWTSFEMQLGEGLLANFQPYSNAAIAVTFDVPNQNPAPVSSSFPVVSLHTPTHLIFSGGTLLPGATMSIRFQIDNNTPQDINGDGAIDGSDVVPITLREFPVGIPAPGAAALLGLGGIMVLRRRRVNA